MSAKDELTTTTTTTTQKNPRQTSAQSWHGEKATYKRVLTERGVKSKKVRVQRSWEG